MIASSHTSKTQTRRRARRRSERPALKARQEQQSSGPDAITTYRPFARTRAVLPVGIGAHQLRAAKRIKNRVANKPDAVIGETRLHAAETTLDAVKRNAAARAQNPRRSKLARRIAAYR